MRNLMLILVFVGVLPFFFSKLGSIMAQAVNILNFEGHMVHVSTTQVNCCSIKAAINYIVNESSSVPMKPYCTY